MLSRKYIAVPGFAVALAMACTDAPSSVSTLNDECSHVDRLPPRLWRLSAEQYSNSVRDLLRLDQGPVLAASGGTAEYAFFSDDSAAVDPDLQYAIYLATSDALTRANLAAIANCAPLETTDSCAARFISDFGSRAFRRPLADPEISELMAVYAVGFSQDFDTGIRLVASAVLQSPSFLYRSELGQPTLVPGINRLTAWEVAAQLSYFFLDSTPDEPLMAAARSGELDTSDGVKKQVDRLLETDAVQRNITRIILNWFNVNQLFSKTKDRAFFQSTTNVDIPQVQEDLYTSAEMFLDDVLWHSGGGRIDALLTTNRFFVNPNLASVYGIPYTGLQQEFVPIDMPANEHRAGILTYPAFLWALSDPSVTSIVKRGKFIHDDVLCQMPGGSAPALLNDPNVQEKLASLGTEIAKSDYRMSEPECKGCHAQIDPYARVLESFDPIGQYRTIGDGLVIDPTWNFTSPPLGSVTGADQFAKAIALGGWLRICAAQKIESYILGRMIQVPNTCEVQDLEAAGNADDTFSNLFRRVALSEFVRERAPESP